VASIRSCLLFQVRWFCLAPWGLTAPWRQRFRCDRFGVPLGWLAVFRSPIQHLQLTTLAPPSASAALAPDLATYVVKYRASCHWLLPSLAVGGFIASFPEVSGIPRITSTALRSIYRSFCSTVLGRGNWSKTDGNVENEPTLQQLAEGLITDKPQNPTTAQPTWLLGAGVLWP